MKELSLKQILVGALIFIALLTMLNTCNSCNGKKQSVKTQKELDSLRIEVSKLHNQVLTFDRAKILFHKENLETELRMLINTNQIFLTKERPDKRVLEIQKELKELE